MRLPTLTLGLLLAASALAGPGTRELPDGATVRFQSELLVSGWYVGTRRAVTDGCSTIYLHEPTPIGGYESVALVAVGKLQAARDDGWTDVAVPQLLAQEPKHCREMLAD